MKTDYTTAMDVLKHQRELALRQQISEQHLKDESIVPQPSASIQVPVSAKQEVSVVKVWFGIQPSFLNHHIAFMIIL